MSLAAVEGIRDRFPNGTIFVLAPARTKDVYAISPAVDQVLGYENNRQFPKSPETLTLVFPLSFRSALTLWRKGFPNRIGYASEGRSFLLSKALDYESWKSRHLHQSTYYRELAESVLGPLPVLPPRLVLSENRMEKAKIFIDSNQLRDRRLIAINPGANYGSAKMWPSDYYVSLIRKILDTLPQAGAILFSGEQDRHVTREIMAKVDDQRLASTDGKMPLSESIALLSLCHYLISNDSGMMHLGAALDMRGVALFGPTDPVATGPMSAKIRLLREPVRCSPCLLRYCPIDHRCMDLLTPERVWNTIREDIFALERK